MASLSDVQMFLVKEIMGAMYMSADELNPDALFSSYGLESTTLVKIVASVNQEFSTQISVQDILPHQSINRAARTICALLEGEKA